MIFHRPVMLKEVVESLNCRKNGVYVDGTLGGGGHAYEILEKTAPDGVLIGIDLDDEALEEAGQRLKCFGERKILRKGNFADIGSIMASLDIKHVDGILFDLGVSSHQLETARRGFSFSQEAPLNMRMDESQSYSAYDLVNNLRERDLEQIIRNYGEEKKAGRIARAIVRKREISPILTTTELAELIVRTVHYDYARQDIHPATRTFQAIRIAVNNELSRLPEAIKSGVDLLNPTGRFSILSFHSLEDRIVKKEFSFWERDCICPPRLPLCNCQHKALIKVLTKKPVRPGQSEIADNPRSRSAKLRTAERI